MEIDGQTDRLSLAFGALADPTRRAILARLASGDADVSELMKPFALSQPTISKHLNVLERAGLVRCGRDSRISLTGWSPFAASGSRNLPAWILT
jgi:DNA-binding transcriptional ArsR family regulator